jgi:hypothetical protein
MAMSKEHKEALAQGRLEARSVKAYLDALGSKRRGRPVTKESLQKKLSTIDSKVKSEPNPLKRLDLMQSRADTEKALGSVEHTVDPEELAAGFTAHARSYSERKGISYSTWRQFGVPAEVLKRAGIPATRRRS